MEVDDFLAQFPAEHLNIIIVLLNSSLCAAQLVRYGKGYVSNI
jgi:hypothetical protein